MYTVHIDFRKRLEKMQEAVKKKSLDLLVGTRLKTVTHACGAFCPWRSAVVIPAEGDIQLICPSMDANRLRQESWLDEVEGYGRYSLMKLVIMKIEELGLSKGKIGYEDGSSLYLPEGFITKHEYEELRQGLPEADLVDAYKIIDDLTLVKEDEEIRLMRQATAIVDYAHEEVAKVLKVGMSEKQIAGIAEKVMRDAGSEFSWSFTGGQEVASGYRTWTGACTPATDKVVQRHEFVLMDLHGMYGLMLGDVSHNAVMGEPNKQQQNVIEAYVRTCEQVVEEMQPYKSLGEVSQNVREFVMKNGWGKFIRGFGHGIGHFGHEWYPTLTDVRIDQVSEPDYKMEPNSIQMIAVTANMEGVGGLRMERPLVITEEGNELLSKLPFEPWIINS
jgi:Xaa-Pro aminopeptidase